MKIVTSSKRQKMSPDSRDKTKARYLTRNIFNRKLTNRNFSEFKKSVYRYYCLLFNTATSTGHNLSSSLEALSNLLMEQYIVRSKTTERVDKDLLS